MMGKGSTCLRRGKGKGRVRVSRWGEQLEMQSMHTPQAAVETQDLVQAITQSPQLGAKRKQSYRYQTHFSNEQKDEIDVDNPSKVNMMLSPVIYPNSSSKCVLYCTAKVLAVCTAVQHLYHTFVSATWRKSTAHVRSAPYISPALVCTTQGQTQWAYNHHSLLGYTLVSSQATLHTYHYISMSKLVQNICMAAYTPCIQ